MAQVKIKTFGLVSVFIILLGCLAENKSVNENELADETKCDTIMTFIIRLIEAQQSFDPKTATGYYVKFDFYDTNGVNNRSKIPIFNQFRDTLNLYKLKELYRNAPFLDNLTMLKGNNNLCENEFMFVNRSQLAELKNQEKLSFHEFNFSYYSLSYPFFSQDGKFFVIELDYYCELMCDYGLTYIFEKKLGYWTLNRIIQRW